MKRLTAIILVATLFVALTACSDKAKDTPTDATGDTTAVDGMEVVVGLDENGNAVTEIYPTTGFAGTTDPMSEVTVTIPYNYVYSLDEKYQLDLQLYCNDNGFISYTADEAAGTVTLRMTAAAHNAFLSQKRFELSNIFVSLINTYSFLDQCIANNMEYTDITLRVIKEEYEKDSSAALVVDYVGNLCMNSYQIFTSLTSYSCSITVVDKDTGDTIDTFSKTSVFGG